MVRCKLGFQVEGEQSRETGREDVVRGHRRAKEREGILRGVEWNTRPQERDDDGDGEKETEMAKRERDEEKGNAKQNRRMKWRKGE